MDSNIQLQLLTKECEALKKEISYERIIFDLKEKALIKELEDTKKETKQLTVELKRATRLSGSSKPMIFIYYILNQFSIFLAIDLA